MWSHCVNIYSPRIKARSWTSYNLKKSNLIVSCLRHIYCISGFVVSSLQALHLFRGVLGITWYVLGIAQERALLRKHGSRSSTVRIHFVGTTTWRYIFQRSIEYRSIATVSSRRIQKIGLPQSSLVYDIFRIRTFFRIITWSALGLGKKKCWDIVHLATECIFIVLLQESHFSQW